MPRSASAAIRLIDHAPDICIGEIDALGPRPTLMRRSWPGHVDALGRGSGRRLRARPCSRGSGAATPTSPLSVQRSSLSDVRVCSARPSRCASTAAATEAWAPALRRGTGLGSRTSPCPPARGRGRSAARSTECSPRRPAAAWKSPQRRRAQPIERAIVDLDGATLVARHANDAAAQEDVAADRPGRGLLLTARERGVVFSPSAGATARSPRAVHQRQHGRGPRLNILASSASAGAARRPRSPIAWGSSATRSEHIFTNVRLHTGGRGEGLRLALPERVEWGAGAPPAGSRARQYRLIRVQSTRRESPRSYGWLGPLGGRHAARTQKSPPRYSESSASPLLSRQRKAGIPSTRPTGPAPRTRPAALGAGN